MNKYDNIDWNVNPQPIPSVYNEGYSQYETLCKLIYQINVFIDNMNLSKEEIDELNVKVTDLENKKLAILDYMNDIKNLRKLSENGNFTGTWNGLEMHETSEGLATDWNNAKGTFNTVTARLNDIDLNFDSVDTLIQSINTQLTNMSHRQVIDGQGIQQPIMSFINGAESNYLEFGMQGYSVKGSVGALGRYEMNLSYNMDYRTGVHKFYDRTKNAYWFAMNDNGVALQFAPKEYSGEGDIWIDTGLTYLFRIDKDGNLVLKGNITATQLVGALPSAENPIAPTFINSWTNLGGTYQTAGYYKDGQGRVHLRGMITGGAVGSIVFYLPSSYRPIKTEEFATSVNGAFGTVRVTSDGSVIVQSGATGYASLNGISFRSGI